PGEAGVAPGGAAATARGPGAGGPAGFRGGGGPGGFGGGFGRFGGERGGRIQFGLYHTWRFEDETLIREGVPVLDFLGGSAVGSRGGRPRHELEFQSGLFRNGLGARLTANWQSGTTVRGGPDGLGGTRGDLTFSDLTTVNLRLFANLGQQPALVRDRPWLRGTRITLAVDNLLGTRIRVRDEAGVTPLSYQPGFLDPLGRSVRISVRKLFF
ncbi:MAG: TonB-dependent receptor, partial [Pseudomonadota bacterium]|nr:TonB-dependent receptor [Pseudomonadota bacterium]